MNKPQAVVHVGYRKAAVEAALGLGVEVVLVTLHPGKPRPPHVAAFHSLEPDSAEADWSALASRIQAEHRVSAVVPLTEASVLPAARLRQGLGVGGLSVDSALNFRDKVRMKRLIRSAGLACAEFVADYQGLSSEQIIARLGLPLIVKPRDSFGGRGAFVVEHPSQLERGLESGWMAESYLSGIEMSVESFVIGGSPVLVNFTEYLEKRHCNVVPAPLEPEKAAALTSFNRQVIRVLGLDRGMTHLEVFLGDEEIVFGEVAARPPGGHIMRLIELAYGFPPYHALLQIELGEHPPLPRTPDRSAGVWIVHPGAGLVSRVRGRGLVERLPGLVEGRFRVKAGSRVEERQGSGQEVGHFVFAARHRSDVVAALNQARRLLKIELD